MCSGQCASGTGGERLRCDGPAITRPVSAAALTPGWRGPGCRQLPACSGFPYLPRACLPLVRYCLKCRGLVFVSDNAALSMSLAKLLFKVILQSRRIIQYLISRFTLLCP
ncbi:hypothetical protein NDU88_004582 [Pleurodeles waltl]|uniref:Uncharacterized protein n=1 Tax=Pleurodeles waltl TaxID=8319 RepID=A0AAV7SJ66_PLEWA|nr:hypothetical protein NDU88_004582 [Pleurodeles waltl]